MFERVDKVNFYLNLAEACARRGTCIRRNYGAVIVKNDEVIATGYTGAARGMQNCCDRGTCKREELGCKPGERYDLCLAGDTKIRLVNGESRTIKELAEKDGIEQEVYSINTETKQVVKTMAKCFRKTAFNSDIIEVTFDNGEKICCTPMHPFMLSDGTYSEAKDLVENDEIMGTVTVKGIEIIRGMKVFSVRELRETEDVYDCTVPNFNNFGIDIGDATVYVHNCVSVHAEMNAIISAARRDMVGATLYLTGIDAKTGKVLDKSEPCVMCRRMIINAGIIAVVGRKGADGDFVRTDVLSYQVFD